MNNLTHKKQVKLYTDQMVGRISNRLLTQQSLAAATLTVVNMPVKETPNNTELYDYTTNANAITIKRAGKYNVVFSIWINSTGSPTTRFFEFYKNGSKNLGTYSSNETSAVSSQFSGTYERTLTLAVGDYVFVKAYCNVITQLGVTGFESGTMPVLTLNYLEN